MPVGVPFFVINVCATEKGLPKKDEVFFWEEEGQHRKCGFSYYGKPYKPKFALTSTSVLEEIMKKRNTSLRCVSFFIATSFLDTNRGSPKKTECIFWGKGLPKKDEIFFCIAIVGEDNILSLKAILLPLIHRKRSLFPIGEGKKTVCKRSPFPCGGRQGRAGKLSLRTSEITPTA